MARDPLRRGQSHERPDVQGGRRALAPWTNAGALLSVLVLLWFAVAYGSSRDPGRGEEQLRPHFDARDTRVEYAGPGREDPAPDGLSEIRIGYFGPSDPHHPEGGDLWLASTLAIDEANGEGGYRDLPFRLIPAWSENPWGTGVARVARLVYADDVWAIVGSIDGATTHLAEQVVAKARLTLISPVSTDKTVNLANVAWMFSCLPADDLQAAALAREISDEIGERTFALISTTDHDSRVAMTELTERLARRGITPLHHLEVEPGAPQFTSTAERVAALDSGAVVVLAGPLDSARILIALREARADLRVFGGASMGRRIFLEEAGRAAEEVTFPLTCDPAALSGDFREIFLSRFGRLPDCATVQAYDATRLLIAAIRRAGLNRARIRDAVEALSPWSGLAGEIEWGPLGENRREVRAATIREGRIVSLDSRVPGTGLD